MVHDPWIHDAGEYAKARDRMMRRREGQREARTGETSRHQALRLLIADYLPTASQRRHGDGEHGGHWCNHRTTLLQTSGYLRGSPVSLTNQKTSFRWLRSELWLGTLLVLASQALRLRFRGYDPIA
jgi:hypothetical protein